MLEVSLVLIMFRFEAIFIYFVIEKYVRNFIIYFVTDFTGKSMKS